MTTVTAACQRVNRGCTHAPAWRPASQTAKTRALKRLSPPLRVFFLYSRLSSSLVSTLVFGGYWRTRIGCYVHQRISRIATQRH
ncbi:unnamed protein product, partial [Ectocarpus fasciculatus]